MTTPPATSRSSISSLGGATRPIVGLWAERSMLRHESSGSSRSSGTVCRGNAIDAMVAASSEFFAQPTEVKRRCTPADPSINRGYAARAPRPCRTASGAMLRPICSKRSTSARTRSTTPIRSTPPSSVARLRRNIWPVDPADLRPALVDYFQAARQLALTMTEVFAVALGLPDGWFAPFVDRSTTTMRAIRYERRAGDERPASRPAAHGCAHRLRDRHGAVRRAGRRSADRRARWCVDRRDPRRRRPGDQPR